MIPRLRVAILRCANKTIKEVMDLTTTGVRLPDGTVFYTSLIDVFYTSEAELTFLAGLVDFLIMWQIKSLKDIQGWADDAVTATVTITTTAVLWGLNARRNSARVKQVITSRWQQALQIRSTVKEYVDEVLEENV